MHGAQADEPSDARHEHLVAAAVVAEAEAFLDHLVVLSEKNVAKEENLYKDRNHVTQAQNDGEQFGFARLVHGKESQAAKPGRFRQVKRFDSGDRILDIYRFGAS